MSGGHMWTFILFFHTLYVSNTSEEGKNKDKVCLFVWRQSLKGRHFPELILQTEGIKSQFYF